MPRTFESLRHENLQPARWWRMREEDRIECQLCPRHCQLREGQAGFCGTRIRHGPGLWLTAYGRTSGLCADPIEKKPLYHFYPGSTALSLGTTGCNLACQFCQNWRISQAHGAGLPGIEALPETIAELAHREKYRSVAFTYNDPIVFAEQAIATAHACHARGLKTVAVTAGYLSPEARADFFTIMDAANVDLKAFSDGFYRRLCHASLQPVLDTLDYLHRETAVWLEVTTLLIPGENDSRDELERAADWFAAHLGPDVPWHFTAFHPDYRLTDRPCTPAAALSAARDIARARGLRYVYLGNIRHPEATCTHCASCGLLLLRRDGFAVLENRLTAKHTCPQCHAPLPGRFAETDQRPHLAGGQ